MKTVVKFALVALFILVVFGCCLGGLAIQMAGGIARDAGGIAQPGAKYDPNFKPAKRPPAKVPGS